MRNDRRSIDAGTRPRAFRRWRAALRRWSRRWGTILLAALIPTVSRSALITGARNRGALIRIEGPYTTSVPGQRGSVYVGESFVACVPDIHLLGPSGLPITAGGRVIKEPVASPRGNVYLPALQRAVADVGLLRLLGAVWFPRRFLFRPEFPRLETGAHLITRASPRPGGSQYAHWFLEHVGQLVAIESVRDRLPENLVHVTNADVAPYQQQTFDLLEIPDWRVVRHRGGVLRVDLLVVATLRTGHNRTAEHDPRLHRRVRAQLTRHGQGRADGASARLAAVMREDATQRRATNVEEARVVLDRWGAVSVGPPLALAEELGVLRECEVLVGIHGAGLAKMLLCPQLRHVIEIVPPLAEPPDLFEKLADGLGVTYERLTGSLPVGAGGATKSSDVVVPVGALADALARALGDPDQLIREGRPPAP